MFELYLHVDHITLGEYPHTNQYCLYFNLHMYK